MKAKLNIIRSQVRRQWDAIFSKNDSRIICIGGECPWHIRNDLIGENSTVISGGAGKDISFELELVQRYKCKIHLFDPSPTGIETMALPANQIGGLIFYPIGLAGKSEKVAFASPINPLEGSFRITKTGNGTASFICRTISSFADEVGFTEMDLLKLDIEGFEFDVLNDIFKNKIIFKQICVELHHFLPGFSRLNTLITICRFHFSGYRLVHKSREDYLFVHRKYI